jgi:hypothetical protein
MANLTRSEALRWDSSLKKVFKGSERWWANFMADGEELRRGRAELQGELSAPGPLRSKPSTMQRICQSYCVESCILGEQGDIAALALPMRRAVEFRSLEFRSVAGRSLPTDSNPVFAFESSLQAIGPTMLSEWRAGKASAERLIDIAHKDQRINVSQIRKDGWGKGTSDAFIIYLLSTAYNIPTHFEPVRPLDPVYQRLLKTWRTEDESEFQRAMQEAAVFHVEHSFYGGAGKKVFEFEVGFDLVYPGELLAVQAVRRRDGLPEFQTGHLLVDTPWSIVRDLPLVPPDALATSLEERLRHDFPQFK